MWLEFIEIVYIYFYFYSYLYFCLYLYLCVMQNWITKRFYAVGLYWNQGHYFASKEHSWPGLTHIGQPTLLPTEQPHHHPTSPSFLRASLLVATPFSPSSCPAVPFAHILLCPRVRDDTWTGLFIAGPSSEVASHAYTIPDTLLSPNPKILGAPQVSPAPDCHREVLKPNTQIFFANPPLLLVLLTSPFPYPTSISPVYLNSSCWVSDLLKFCGYLMVAGMEHCHGNFSV